jgi:hypothetical protein
MDRNISSAIQQKPKPVKREVISETPWKEKVKYNHPTKGKKTVTVEGKNQVEAEIENTHLEKIAPLTYVCTDNEKILLIPISLAFSQEEYAQWLTQGAAGLNAYLQRVSGKMRESSDPSPTPSGETPSLEENPVGETPVRE